MKNEQTLLTRRVEKVLPSKEGLQKLIDQKGEIRLYQGFDPTAKKLHLGHTVGLRKLMDFANAGHDVIFLFGTGTVLVGDPSERDTGRKLITEEEIRSNIKTWQKQVSPIVDFEKVTIKYNGDWLPQLTLREVVQIASNISAIQLFKRKSFTRRVEAGDTVWYHETMYPLLQGYDSVAMDVDLEIGGTDQEFNMLIGRELQKKMNNKEKYVLTTPMILGTDGGQMSKTTGNCIWLDDQPEDMYGKLMSIPDAQIESYINLVTDIPIDQVDLTNPLESKKSLAFDVTKQFHDASKAQAAQAEFEATVQKKQIPTDLPTITTKVSSQTILELCKLAEVGESSGQIKRTIAQGGVQFNNQKILDPNHNVELDSENILKFGKRNYIKILLKK